jgi:hypothetical protein
MFLLVGTGGFILGITFTKPQTSTSYLPSPKITNSTDITTNWSTYTLKTLGISFKLPPELSNGINYEELTKSSENGNVVCFESRSTSLIKSVFAGTSSTCLVNQFSIASESQDYEAGREGMFQDVGSFAYQNGKYFIRNGQLEILNSATSIYKTIEGHEFLIVKSHNTPGEYPLMQSPSDGYIGAIINLENDTYPALIIQMQITPMLTEDLFKQILSTFQFFG